MHTEPYAWAEINNLFSAKNAEALASSFPLDHFKTIVGYGGEKDYRYEARALVTMQTCAIAYPEALSEAWRNLANDLARFYRKRRNHVVARQWLTNRRTTRHAVLPRRASVEEHQTVSIYRTSRSYFSTVTVVFTEFAMKQFSCAK